MKKTAIQLGAKATIEEANPAGYPGNCGNHAFQRSYSVQELAKEAEVSVATVRKYFPASIPR